MMVTRARAHLGYEYSEIGVYSDHADIAKIDLSSKSPFWSIKQAIDRALDDSEQKESRGRSVLHSSNDALLRQSLSTTTLSEHRGRPTARLLPGLADQRSSSTATVMLGGLRSQSTTSEDTGSETKINVKSARSPSNRTGENLPTNKAIHDGNITRIREISKAALLDAQLDKPNSQGYTPLMVAAATDQEQVVGELIARGASMEISGPSGDTAFHLACKHAGVATVSRFLNYPRLLDIRDSEGRTPLMSSIQSSRTDTVKSLLKVLDNLEAFDTDGKTAVHYAAISGITEIVRLLIEDHGANINKTTKLGWTPLHYAAHSWHPRIVELLATSGANCKAVTSKEDGARTAIHLVLLRPGRTRCISRLIAHGLCIEQPDGAGNTPLHWAAQYGEPDSVKWLISKKANLESRTSDSSRMTPLHTVARIGRLEIAKILLDAGANKEAAMELPSGKTALHIATEESRTDLIKELLDRKANVDPVYKDLALEVVPTFRGTGPPEITPLTTATENENLDIMSMLLEAGADVEGRNASYKFRPLFIAVKQGNLKAVRKLLDYNAIPETKGFATPLTKATEAGNIPIMEELLAQEPRPDVERTNTKRYSCLFIAASLGHVDAVNLLLDHGADPDREVRFFPSKKTKRVGEYFESNVSEETRSRIGRMLSYTENGGDGKL